MYQRQYFFVENWQNLSGMSYLITGVRFLWNGPVLQCLLSESLPQLLDLRHPFLDLFAIPFTLCQFEKHAHPH